jgi:hypothetical protein
MFDRLTQLPASPLTYLVVLGACALAVFPVNVVDEDRHRGQAVERGVWPPVIVGPQPAGEGTPSLGVAAVQPGVGPFLEQGAVNRSTLPLV